MGYIHQITTNKRSFDLGIHHTKLSRWSLILQKSSISCRGIISIGSPWLAQGMLLPACILALLYCAIHSTSTPSSRAARRGQWGSLRNSLPKSTKSASPRCRMFSAWSGSVINPTAPVGIPTLSLMAFANGTWYSGPTGTWTQISEWEWTVELTKTWNYIPFVMV